MLSTRTFLRDLIVGIISNLLFSLLIIGISPLTVAVACMGVTFLLTIAYLFWKYGRFFKVLWSGFYGYYYTFPIEENRAVWQEVNTSFKYLGISADTIMIPFKAWLEGPPTPSSAISFQMLLMDPDGKALAKQIAYQKGLNWRSSDQLRKLEDEIAPVRQRIRSSIEMLKALNIHKNGLLYIRLYDEFVPWWIYVLNDKKIFVGVLPPGKQGLDAPVMVMKYNNNYSSMFDAFHNTWDRMWNDARNA